MTTAEPSDEPRPATTDDLPDHLPPVEPPSAGFIVQLFLVPALIVAAVIGMYLLFGKLAASETDWRQLVTDIRSENPNVRWRAALNLAEGLDADESRQGSGPRLASIPEIATALNDLAVAQLQSARRTDEQEQQLQFLMKALGRMDTVDQIWPALSLSLKDDQEPELRKLGLQAIAMIAGRRRSREEVLFHPELIETVIHCSESPDPVLRQHGAFALGLLPGEASSHRLDQLLQDQDELTRINAAIAFARENSTKGLSVFRHVLVQARDWPAQANSAADIEALYERQLILRNTLHALEQLRPLLSVEERNEVIGLLKPLGESLSDQSLRLKVTSVLLAYEAG